MSTTPKAQLLQKLSDTRKQLLSTIENVDKNKMVYSHGEAGRVRDIIVNVAFWEYEAAKCLNAFLAGSEYCTTNGYTEEKLHAINKQNWAEFKDQDYSTVVDYLDKGRALMIDALQQVAERDLAAEMMGLFGGKDTVENFINGMIDHEKEHLGEIEQVN